MADKNVNIPDLPPSDDSQNFVPINIEDGSKTSPMNSKKKKILLVSLFLLVVLGIAAWFLQSTLLSQSGETASPPPACHNGTPPLPIDPKCGSLGNPQPCPAPDEGYCKEKGTCFECRFRHFGLRMICQCPASTPTTPLSPPVDIKPSSTPKPTPPEITPEITVTLSPTPPDSCPLPTVRVEVECLQCSGQQ